jgi:hypothetical protein
MEALAFLLAALLFLLILISFLILLNGSIVSFSRQFEVSRPLPLQVRACWAVAPHPRLGGRGPLCFTAGARAATGNLLSIDLFIYLTPSDCSSYPEPPTFQL